MKVTFLNQEYRCDSNIGIFAMDHEDLIKDLTDIIDFDNSRYPKKWIETEDKKAFHQEKQTQEEYFNGQEKIRPGRMFLYDGQVFAVNSDKRLVLVASETGALAVKRFIEDILKTELKLAHGEERISDVRIEEIESIPEGEKIKKISIPYYTGKVWRDRVGNLIPFKFRTVFNSEDSFIPIELYVSNFNIYFCSDIVFEDQIEDLVQDFLVWTYKNYREEYKDVDEEQNNSENVNPET